MTPSPTPSAWPRRRRRPGSGADRGPRRVGESLDEAIAGLSPPPAPRPGGARSPVGASALGMVFGDWDGIVGESLARHVQPVTLSGGVLTVRVDAPPWATQVRALGASILARVAEVTGEAPDELRVVVRPSGR